jgi:UDP-glucose 4-epimerase
MTLLVSGGAGFIGPSLIERAARDGHDAVVIDNLSRGRREHLGAATLLIEADLAQQASVDRIVQALADRRIDECWHLAANSDIPAGVEDPSVDLRDTFLSSFHFVALAQRVGVKRFFFASSSAVYGDQGSQRISESLGPLLPISNYGAMKLASEAQISAAAESFIDCAGIYRFPNVVGTPATHGVLLDFVRKLKADPARLSVLGDGTQQKAYLHVSELVDAMWFASRRQTARREVLNIGPVDDGVTVRWIAEQVCARVAPRAEIVFGRGNKGWVGDVPRFRYDTARLAALGWQPALDSRAAIVRSIDEIARQEGL